MAIGKVIKGDAVPETTTGHTGAPESRRRVSGVVNAEVFEAHQEAQAILDAAHAKAEQIIDGARREREDVLKKAAAEGRQEGLKKVTEEFAKAHMQRGEMLAQAEPQILKLALEIAEKIIGRDMERDDTALLQLCATAIEGVRNAQSMVLRVSPEDASMLRDKRKQLMEMIGRLKDIAIKEDPDVERYGCVIETDSGTIDAQLHTQLEMLLNVLVPDTSRKEHR